MKKKVLIISILLIGCFIFNPIDVLGEVTGDVTNLKPTGTGCAILTKPILDKLNWFFDIIKYGGAALAVLLGSFDFFKAVTSDDANANKNAGKRFMVRLIAAALIFLLPLIIQFVLNNVEIEGFNKNAVTCGVGISDETDDSDVKLDPYEEPFGPDEDEYSNNQPVKVLTPNMIGDEGVDDVVVSNASNSSSFYSESKEYTDSEKIAKSFDVINTLVLGVSAWVDKDGHVITSTSARAHIREAALDALYNTANYIYLLPNNNERNNPVLKNISNVGKVSGGDCINKTYNGEKCVEYDGKSYYGADCNSFVGSIYHKVLGIESDSRKFFSPSKNGFYWSVDDIEDAKEYFESYKYSSLTDVEKNADMGDAIARICKKSDGSYSTHIGIYVNAGYVIDNAGWTSKDKRFNPIKYRTLEEFKDNYTNCKYTLFKLKKLDTKKN